MKNKLNNKTVLVTGGAGFIGSNMCQGLLELGAKVVCFDNLSTGKLSNIQEFKQNKKFKFIKGDTNNLKDIKRVFDNYRIDYVFHYAAMVGVDRTLANPLGVLQDIEGIKNVLNFSLRDKIKKVVYSSSSEIYGEAQEVPEREDSTPFNTRIPYAIVKATGENYLKAYFKIYHLPTVNLRFFNVYGPKQSEDFVVSKFIKQTILGKPMTILGDGKQTRDFVFIKDNINATLQVLQNSKINGESINIGTGEEVSILNLAKKIIQVSNKKNLKIKFLPARKEGDVERRCPDITKMKKLLKYTPKYSLDQGLKIIYQWLKTKNYETQK